MEEELKKKKKELERKLSSVYGPNQFDRDFRDILDELPKINESVIFIDRCLYITDTYTSRFDRQAFIGEILNPKSSLRKICFPSKAYERLVFWVPIHIMFRYNLSHIYKFEGEFESYKFPDNLDELWKIEDRLEEFAISKPIKLREYTAIKEEIALINDKLKEIYYQKNLATRAKRKEEKLAKEKAIKDEISKVAKENKEKFMLIAALEHLTDIEFEKIVIPEYTKRLKRMIK